MSTEKKNPRKKGKRILKRIILALILLIAIGVASIFGMDALKAQYTISYDSYTATVGSISNALSFSGSLSLVDSASYTASTAATVRAVYVAAGDPVKNGDKLVRLSNGETFKAEFDGKVNVMNVAVGDEVAADDTIVQVANFADMQVSIRVDEYDISNVQVGDVCTITTTASEQTYSSKIKSINYISSSTGNVAYYTATLDVTVGEGTYPGMQVTVTIPQESAENVVILKADALSFDEKNSAFVYKYNEENVLESIPVEVGVSNGNYVEIKSGVKNGDTVYAQTKVNAGSTWSNMMSGMFGTTQVNPQRGQWNRNNNNGNFGGGNDPGSNFGGGNNPGGNFGGGR